MCTQALHWQYGRCGFYSTMAFLTGIYLLRVLQRETGEAKIKLQVFHHQDRKNVGTVISLVLFSGNQVINPHQLFYLA